MTRDQIVYIAYALALIGVGVIGVLCGLLLARIATKEDG